MLMTEKQTRDSKHGKAAAMSTQGHASVRFHPGKLALPYHYLGTVDLEVQLGYFDLVLRLCSRMASERREVLEC